MSDIISISTNDLGTRRVVEIDGHTYTVRKLGAGEDLDVSQITRESIALLEKATKDDWGEEEVRRLEDLKAKALEIYTKTFDDGGDGTKSRELMTRLSDEERNKLYSMIFPPAYDTEVDIVEDVAKAVEKLEAEENKETEGESESPQPA